MDLLIAEYARLVNCRLSFFYFFGREKMREPLGEKERNTYFVLHYCDFALDLHECNPQIGLKALHRLIAILRMQIGFDDRVCFVFISYELSIYPIGQSIALLENLLIFF